MAVGRKGTTAVPFAVIDADSERDIILEWFNHKNQINHSSDKFFQPSDRLLTVEH